MVLNSYTDPVTKEHRFMLTISDAEMYTAYDRLSSSERKTAMPFFGRKEASIEESLMGLQIIARHVEEAHDRAY